MTKIQIEYNKVSEEEDLQRAVKELIGKSPRTIFSVFKDAEHKSTKKNGWLVSHPDILSEEPVIGGDVNLVYEGWEDTAIEKVSNPTWRDIITFFDNVVDGHHVFLEGLCIEDNDVYILAGS
jgi:hypothetical protein